jgi:hypothetical protein
MGYRFGVADRMKSDFLWIIAPIRERAFNPRNIRQSFKDRGIYPVNGRQIVADLTTQMVIPELYTPELRSAGVRTLSPEILSSSVDNSPPATIEALERNQAKIIRDLNRDLERAQ